MASRSTDHGKEGRCRHCGGKLGLLQRLSKQDFCSNEHRSAYLLEQERLALACLQDGMREAEPLAPEVAAAIDAANLDAGPPEELLKAALTARAPEPGHQEQQLEAAQVSAGDFSESDACAPEGEIHAEVAPAVEPEPPEDSDPPAAGFLALTHCLGPLAPNLGGEAAMEVPITLPAAAGRLSQAGLPESGHAFAVTPRPPDARPAAVSPGPQAFDDGMAVPAAPALALTVAFDWEAAGEQERLRIEREQEPDTAGPAPLAGPSACRLQMQLRSTALAARPWAPDIRLPGAAPAPAHPSAPRTAAPALSTVLAAMRAPDAASLSGGFRRTNTTADHPSAMPSLPPGAASPTFGACSQPGFSMNRRQFAIGVPESSPGVYAIRRDAVAPAEESVLAVIPRSGLSLPAGVRLRLASPAASDHAGPAPAAPTPGAPAGGAHPLFEPAPPLTGSLAARALPRLVPSPPARRERIRISLDMRDPGAAPLLDPFTCPFGSQEDAWQPVL